MIGIFTSVWTAIVVTRALVNFYYGGRQVKSLWIGNYI
jgi:preprotein translocase subunit SecD